MPAHLEICMETCRLLLTSNVQNAILLSAPQNSLTAGLTNGPEKVCKSSQRDRTRQVGIETQLKKKKLEEFAKGTWAMLL